MQELNEKNDEYRRENEDPKKRISRLESLIKHQVEKSSLTLQETGESK
jgi:hypothetical protein